VVDLLPRNFCGQLRLLSASRDAFIHDSKQSYAHSRQPPAFLPQNFLIGAGSPTVDFRY